MFACKHVSLEGLFPRSMEFIYRLQKHLVRVICILQNLWGGGGGEIIFFLFFLLFQIRTTEFLL